MICYAAQNIVSFFSSLLPANVIKKIGCTISVAYASLGGS
uniref:Uncharacterized protein n=1 Tax=Arundo donax TaxID=35708 RepID=A0A0A9H1K4_ARUDO